MQSSDHDSGRSCWSSRSPGAAAPPPEVKIHAPDAADVPAGKGGKGKAAPGSLKPIVRQETKVGPKLLIGIAVVIAAAVAGTWFGADFWQKMPIVRIPALLIVSIPTAIAGYAFLRDDELEPYRGGALWLRSAICSLVYTGLWVGFYFIPPDLSGSAMNWFFLGSAVCASRRRRGVCLLRSRFRQRILSLLFLFAGHARTGSGGRLADAVDRRHRLKPNVLR